MNLSKNYKIINSFFSKNILGIFFVTLVSFLFFLYCLAPGIGFGDTAILIDNIQRLIINSEVNTHPLTVILGKIFSFLPFGDLAFRANLVSAVAGSVALGIFFKAIQELHENVIISAITTLALGLSYSFLWHSTIIENYNVSSIITAASLLFYVRIDKRKEEKWFYPLFFLFGIGIFNHVQMGFMGLGIGVLFLLHFFQLKNRMPFFLKSLAGFVIGMIPWTYLILHELSLNGKLLLILKNAFMGSFGGVFFSQSLLSAVIDFVILYIFQFPNLFFILPLTGLWFVIKKSQVRNAYSGALAHLLTNLIFFSFYGTWDKFAFLLQSYIILVFLGSFTLNEFQYKSTKTVIGINVLLFLSILWGSNFFALVNKSSKDPKGFWHTRYNNSYSHNLYDQAVYVINPFKQDFREVEIFCNLIFAKLPENSVMPEDDSRTYYPLADYYQKHYQKRKDIKFLLMNSWGIEGWGMNANQLTTEITNTVQSGVPFFIPTLSSPYQEIINALSKNSNIYFEKFSLSPDRWIYQIKSKELNPQKIYEDSGIRDFQLNDVSANSQISSLTRQFMYAYGGDWDSGDQIFGSGEKGSFLEFNFNHKNQQLVNIQTQLTTAPDFAIVDIFLNDKLLFGKVDLYSQEVKRYSTFPTRAILKQGKNRLRLIIVDKNQKSSGYKLGIDSIVISH